MQVNKSKSDMTVKSHIIYYVNNSYGINNNKCQKVQNANCSFLSNIYQLDLRLFKIIKTYYSTTIKKC
jgi:hypothetical protein